jgi:hypothetical protein
VGYVLGILEQVYGMPKNIRALTLDSNIECDAGSVNLHSLLDFEPIARGALENSAIVLTDIGNVQHFFANGVMFAGFWSAVE